MHKRKSTVNKEDGESEFETPTEDDGEEDIDSIPNRDSISIFNDTPKLSHCLPLDLLKLVYGFIKTNTTSLECLKVFVSTSLFEQLDNIQQGLSEQYMEGRYHHFDNFLKANCVCVERKLRQGKRVHKKIRTVRIMFMSDSDWANAILTTFPIMADGFDEAYRTIADCIEQVVDEMRIHVDAYMRVNYGLQVRDPEK